MKSDNEIEELYYRWLYEHDEVKKSKLKSDFRKEVTPKEFLRYTISFCDPFDTFGKLFTLDEFFEAIEEMERNGEDYRELTNKNLFINNPDDIKCINRLAQKKNLSTAIKDLHFWFIGSNVFTFGDVKSIGANFPFARIGIMDIEQIESVMSLGKDCKGMPITIKVDNIGQLLLEKLAEIEKVFDVEGIKVEEDTRTIGENSTLYLRTYKQILCVANDIISNIYINENLDRMHKDYQIALQILDILSQRIEYDYDAAKMIKDSYEVTPAKVRHANGIVGVLTGKAICMGYSTILRNLLSCVGIKSTTIVGKGVNNEAHAWNQVKLGDKWFNADLTYALKALSEGKPSGDLFMSDMTFYGERRRTVLNKGQEINGEKIESTLLIGGHSQESVGRKHCEGFIPPYLIAFLIKKSRHYNEEYQKGRTDPGYKGVIPYVGSNEEKERSSNRNITIPTR